MVTIYTTNSCSSCRKAVQWLKDNNVEYVEKNMFTSKISESDIKKMLENTENGFEDIISTRSKIFIENKIDLDSMKFSELQDFIISNPSVLKRPIIVSDTNFQAGYDDDEITAFKPRKFRRMFGCEKCHPNPDECDYAKSLECMKISKS